jgi:NAD(P)-dependent dehydrogenase (short-subunit alcohol dehydrogenase family)
MTEQTSPDWLGLSGRVCVVTGGGGGIGRAVASSLARAGAPVAAIDRDERSLEATRAELRELGRDHVVTGCDTSSAESVAAASETIENALGSCGVLVNAAAVLRPGGLDRLLPLRPDFRPANAQARAWQSGSCLLDRRQPRPGAERRL